MEILPLIYGILIPIGMGAFAAALKFKEKALGNGEEFSAPKFYSTLIVAGAIGVINFATNGALISEVDLQTQLMAYAGIIVLGETLIKLVFRAAGQSPGIVTALVGAEAGEAVAQAVAEAKGTGGDSRSILMPESSFKWMTFGHTDADILGMKKQVMAAEEAGMKHYYVTWSGGVYLIEFGSPYGTDLRLAHGGDPVIVPAPGASGT